MQFVKESQAPEASFQRITDVVGKCDLPFNQSQLYSPKEEVKFVDTEQRTSKYRDIQDPDLYEACEELVIHLNHEDDTRSFHLVRNNVTHIIYEKGGFFKRHNDFLSLTSNIVEEYTLILCITPTDKASETVGGETLVHVRKTTSAPNSDDENEIGASTAETKPSTSTSNDEVFTFTSKATVTPGHMLLFRKDQDHEGALLEAGEKHILTLNLWSMKKTSERTLMVVFPQQEEDTTENWKANDMKNEKSDKFDTQEESAEDILSNIADQSKHKSYFIPCSQLRLFPDTLLSNYVWFDDLGSGCTGNGQETTVNSNMTNPLLIFECTQGTYEEFDAVYKILMGMYVDEAQIAKGAHLIHYFGIPSENILVQHSYDPQRDGNYISVNAMNKSGDDEVGGNDKQEEYGGEEENEEEEEEKGLEEVGSENDASSDQPSSHDNHMIICESRERALLVSRMARALGLPYVPFRILFAEGTASYGGEMDSYEDTKIPMSPIHVTIGTYDNILVRRSMMHTNVDTFESYLSIKSMYIPQAIYKYVDDADSGAPIGEKREEVIQILKTKNKVVTFCDPDSLPLGDIAYIEDFCSSYQGVYRFNLHLAPPPASETVDVWSPPGKPDYFCLQTGYQAANPEGCRFMILPEAPEEDIGSGDGDEKKNFDSLFTEKQRERLEKIIRRPLKSKYFHYDSRGNICFNEEEAEAATERVSNMNLDGRILKQINSLPFHISQMYGGGEMYFCNEEVYVNLNMLEVNGVIRLE